MEDPIGRWVAGDPRAADELYSLYYARVREFALRLGTNLNEADEIAHEALAAGLEGLREGKHPDRFTFWLLGIARHLRCRKRRPDAEELGDVVEPSRRGARTQVVLREMNVLLERSLEDLAREDREVLELLHRSGLPRKEIAERLGVSLETLHARCERLYARLRGSLSRHFTTLALAGIASPPVTLERVMGLRPSFRAVVIARHLEGLSDAAGAAKLAVPEATYRARLQSAYEMLKGDSDSDFTPAREEWKKQRAKGDPGTQGTKGTRS